MLSNAPMQEKSLCIVSLSWIHWRLFCALKPEMRRNFNIFVITMPLCRICLLLLSNQNCGWAIICPLCVALKGSCHRLTCNIQNPCGLECGMSAVCTRNTETVWLFFFPIPNIWAVIFCYAVSLEQFLGNRWGVGKCFYLFLRPTKLCGAGTTVCGDGK